MVKVIVRRNRALGIFIDRVRSLFGKGNAKSYNDLVNEHNATLEVLHNTQRAFVSANAERFLLRGSCTRMASQLEAHRKTRAMIAAQETPGANATARRMAALARGDA